MRPSLPTWPPSRDVPASSVSASLSARWRESEARWAANTMDVKEADKDSALESSEVEEENNNNSGCRLAEFSPYLAMLRAGGRAQWS